MDKYTEFSAIILSRHPHAIGDRKPGERVMLHSKNLSSAKTEALLGIFGDGYSVRLEQREVITLDWTKCDG